MSWTAIQDQKALQGARKLIEAWRMTAAEARDAANKGTGFQEGWAEAEQLEGCANDLEKALDSALKS